MSAAEPCPSSASRRVPASLVPVVVATAIRALAGAATCAALSAGVAAAQPFDPGAPLVVEGDILVAPAGLRGVGMVAGTRRWINGEVPYVLAPTLGDTTVEAIAEAVARWNAVSGVTLVAVGAAGPVPFDHLVFRSGPGCASWVGRQGGPQEVWIGPDCTRGSVMHEIGHALGLEHEHTRADRDTYVQVLWDNIVPEKRHNFAIAPDGTRGFGDYDLESIMHYGPTNFSVDGAPTIVPRTPVAGSTMGQRDAPSAGDLAAVARLYASDLALSVGVDDERRAREITLFVTNHHSQGAHDVRIALDASGARISGGDDGWRCGRLDPLLECRLERLAGHAGSRLVLALEMPRDAATLGATLSSKTPDLDPANNGGSVHGGSVPELARATFADPTSVPDDAADTRGAEPALGGAGAPSLLALLALALGRRRAGRY